MTIRAIADQLGVTPVTIYRRLKQRGIDVATLRDADGNITNDGASVIASLFDVSSDEAAIQARFNGVHRDSFSDTKQDVSTLQTECAVLRERCERLQEAFQRSEDECKRLREQVDTLTGMLQREQDQRVRLLEAGGKRRGFWAWLRGGRSGDSSGE